MNDYSDAAQHGGTICADVLEAPADLMVASSSSLLLVLLSLSFLFSTDSRSSQPLLASQAQEQKLQHRRSFEGTMQQQRSQKCYRSCCGRGRLVSYTLLTTDMTLK